MTPRRYAAAFGRVAAALSVAALAACGPAADTAPDAASGADAAGSDLGRRPHILLLSLDTVRADALGPYRGGRPTVTPNLDAFAADAVVFERAVVPMPFTLPSHMSMLTGLHPVEHRVSTEKDRLPPGIETLAQWLRAAGYRTVGRVTNEWLKGEFGFARGFESYERLRHELTYAPRVNAAALDALDEAQADERPLFLFLHYMDAHSDFGSGRSGNRLPYYAPQKWLGDLATDHRDRRYCDEQDRCATDYLNSADREGRELPPERLDELRGLYEAGIAQLDEDLGAFFDTLRERGIYDDALIVVVSDHGEEFREHGKLLHSQTYEESVRVPLLVKLPGNRRAGERIEGLAAVSDLPATILGQLGGGPGAEDAAAQPASGVDPAAALLHEVGDQIVQPIDLLATSGAPGGQGPERERALAQDKLVRSRWALTQGRFKLIRDLKDESQELYDLVTDPGETTDLAAERPRVAEGLSRRLERELRDRRRHGRELAGRVAAEGAAEDDAAVDAGAEESLLDAEERERLKALGYL